MNHSFTDEQLLNLINNTIVEKSEYLDNDFTGGGVQITSTYNHKIVKHKVYLTFGYDDKRNSKSINFNIDETISFIWQQAILLKVKSMQTLNSGDSISELNRLMNTKIDRDNKIIDRDKECKEVVTKVVRTKSFSFSLSKNMQLSNTNKEYQEKLREYIQANIKGLTYEDFYNACEMKGYKYKNYKLVYDKWTKDYKEKATEWSEY